MAARRKSATDTAAVRIRHLIALDAANVMKRLVTRQDEMVSLFSRLRDRGPMLENVRSWFLTITFGELSLLDPAEQSAVNEFHELLGEVRWYVQYTEDMPSTVQTKVAQFVRRLDEVHRKLSAAIGPPEAGGVRVIDAQVIGKSEPRVANARRGRR